MKRLSMSMVFMTLRSKSDVGFKFEIYPMSQVILRE